MGFGEIGALRVSIGHETGERELTAFSAALQEIARRRAAVKPRSAAA